LIAAMLGQNIVATHVMSLAFGGKGLPLGKPLIAA